MKSLITTLSALAFGAALSLAQDKPPGAPGDKPGRPDRPGGDRPQRNPEEVFKKLDANSDGSISLEEFKTGPRAQQDPARAEEAFKRMDKDANGKVSLEEFKTGRPPGRGGPGGPGGEGGRGGGKPGEPGGKPGGPGGRPGAQ